MEVLLACCGTYGIGEDTGGCTFTSLLLADMQVQGSQAKIRQKTGQNPTLLVWVVPCFPPIPVWYVTGSGSYWRWAQPEELGAGTGREKLAPKREDGVAADFRSTTSSGLPVGFRLGCKRFFFSFKASSLKVKGTAWCLILGLKVVVCRDLRWLNLSQMPSLTLDTQISFPLALLIQQRLGWGGRNDVYRRLPSMLWGLIFVKMFVVLWEEGQSASGWHSCF